MRWTVQVVAGVGLMLLAGCAAKPTDDQFDRIFAAVEEDGAIAVLDSQTGELIQRVDLTSGAGAHAMRFNIHNVQGAPDGRLVWATAMPADMAGGHGGASTEEQLVGLDARELTIQKRINLGMDKHVAHVVISGNVAYVTANEANEIMVVDLVGERVERTIALPDGTSPHGLRVSPDARRLIVAGMGTGSILLVDVETGATTSHALPGRAVQTALLPDGTTAYASIYDTRQVARLSLGSGELRLLDMPAGSAGPVQLYPTPDSKYVWVADQGLLDNRAAGTQLVRLNVETSSFDLAAQVSPGPHGVVVGHDGKYLWATTLVEGRVEMVDASAGQVLASQPVGNKPNGITCVRWDGSMP